jgi:hypothetical protein
MIDTQLPRTWTCGCGLLAAVAGLRLRLRLRLRTVAQDITANWESTI